MNRFQFLGRLTKDVEMRVTTSSSKVAVFDLAVNRKYVEKGKERQTDFFKIIAFGKTGEFAEKYFKKGQQVLVEGRIQNRTWEDQNGQKRYATDFIAEKAYFADSNKTASNNTVNDEFVQVSADEELPF